MKTTAKLSLLCVLAACGDGGDGAAGGPGSGGSSEESSPESAAGSCAGALIECYHFGGDPSTCSFHAGCHWDNYTEDCNGNQLDCDEIWMRDDCVRQTGCTWTHADGTKETRPGIVECKGQPVSCGQYPDEDTCNAQYACFWDELDEGCDVNTSLPWHRSRHCDEFDTNGRVWPSNGGFPPQIALELCNRVEGCSGRLLDSEGNEVDPDDVFGGFTSARR